MTGAGTTGGSLAQARRRLKANEMPTIDFSADDVARCLRGRFPPTRPPQTDELVEARRILGAINGDDGQIRDGVIGGVRSASSDRHRVRAAIPDSVVYWSLYTGRREPPSKK